MRGVALVTRRRRRVSLVALLMGAYVVAALACTVALIVKVLT
jgi:hypothetical protein